MLRFIALAMLALGCNAQYGGGFVAPVSFAAPAPIAQTVDTTYGTKFAAPAPVKTTQTYAAPQMQTYAAPQQQYYGPVEAAVHSRRTVEFRNVVTQRDYIHPQVIEVNSDNLPVQINFRSSSSPVHVQQIHTPSVVGPAEHNSFQDQPHRIVNEVVKPIIQEVREVIQPYRRVTQEIKPVIEEIHTIVHKGERVAVQQPIVQQPIVQQLLPLKTASYGTGAALAVNNAYKAAAKAAKAA